MTAPAPPHPSRFAGLLLPAMALLTLLALILGQGAWSRPVPSLLIDPFGGISPYAWPSWDPAAHGLGTQDQVVAVNNIPLPPLRLPPLGPDLFPATRFDQLIQATQHRPSPSGSVVTLTLIHPAAPSDLRPLPVAVAPLGLWPFTALHLGFIGVAWLWLAAATAASLLRPGSPAVRAFSRLAALMAVVLITVFDFHTSRRLVPLFLLAYALLPAALLELGLRFPSHGGPLGLHREPLLRLPRLLGPALLLFTLAAWTQGRPFMPLLTRSVGAALLLLCALLAIGALRSSSPAEARQRAQLRLGLCSLGPVCLLPGLALLDSAGLGRLSPLLLLGAVPVTLVSAVGVSYALLRYDLWDGPAVVPRSLLRPSLTLILGALCALLSTLALAVAAVDPDRAALAVAAPPVLIVSAIALQRRLLRWLGALLFPSHLPTVEQLSLWFRDLFSKASIADAVEAEARRWLDCERVRFLMLPMVPAEREDAASGDGSLATSSMTNSLLLAPSSIHDGLDERLEYRVLRRAARRAGIEGIGLAEAIALCGGRVVRPSADDGARWARLLVPARYREQLVGVLAVSGRSHGPLLTSEDETLLLLLANQAALALACVSATEKVESLRQAQQAALRTEKEAALGTVAAEVAHEIRTPINFLRLLLDSCHHWLHKGAPPEPADLESAREEIDRLERMAGNLRRMATPRALSRQPVPLRDLCTHVAMILRERLAERSLVLEVDEQLEVSSDRDALVQILVNLVSNAIDASTSGRVGVSSQDLGGSQGADDRRLRLTVWDTGPGFTHEVGKLFQPWFTTKRTGSGLGLPITRRLARAHGWEIGASRREGRTCFDLLIPTEDWRRRPPEDSDADGEAP